MKEFAREDKAISTPKKDLRRNCAVGLFGGDALYYFGAQPVLPEVVTGEQLALPDLTVGALAGFFAPQQALLFLAAQQVLFFLAAQQPALPELVDGAFVFAVQVAAIAWLETTAAAVTTEAPTICFKVFVRELDFIWELLFVSNCL